MKRVAILMYHLVDHPTARGESRLCCSPSQFCQQMAWLHASGKAIVPLTDVVVTARGEGRVPANAVAVTFDDGYAGFYEYALPVLREFAIPATMFAVAGRVGGHNDWKADNNLPLRSLMSAQQLRELPDLGIAVGSHSMTHPRLPELDDGALEEELTGSRKRLEDLLGRPVSHLAYPYGHYDPRVIESARRAGYLGACSTRSGFNVTGVDPFSLHRIDVYGYDSLWQFRHKLELGTNDYSFATHLKYYWTRLAAAAPLR